MEGGERDQHQSLFDPKTIYSSHKTKDTVNVASLLTGKAHRQHADYVPERIRRQDSLFKSEASLASAFGVQDICNILETLMIDVM